MQNVTDIISPNKFSIFLYLINCILFENVVSRFASVSIFEGWDRPSFCATLYHAYKNFLANKNVRNTFCTGVTLDGHNSRFF